MRLIVIKKKQLIGKLVGFEIIINGKPVGKLYEGSPLVFENNLDNLNIEVKQPWLKSTLHIKNPNENEKIEVSYSLSDNMFLLYGFITFLLIVLFLFFKLVFLSYIALALQFWLLFQFVKKGAIVIIRNTNLN